MFGTLPGHREANIARRIRSSSLETRTARLKLAPRRKPFFQTISNGIAVGYRRNANGAGTWSVRAAAGNGSNWLKRIAVADDHETADGKVVMDFWQACDAARARARADDTKTNGERPATVSEALDAYEADLRARGAGTDNVSRIRHNLPATISAQLVSQLTPRELRGWRDRMMKGGMSGSAADRTSRALRAALTLASHDDERIKNASAWKTGLKRLPDGDQARPNVALPDDVVRAIVATAYTVEPMFGLLVEVLASTCEVRTPVLRLVVGDLEDGAAPRLQMPSSRKGRNRKIQRKSLPISPALAAALRAVAAGRPDSDRLLVRADGRSWPWRIRVMFKRVVAELGLDPELSPICLRHSSITRALQTGTPIALVASSRDTSAAIIARHYARHIVDNSDTLLRRGMLDMTTPADNVLKLPAGRKS
jgi:integrase